MNGATTTTKTTTTTTTTAAAAAKAQQSSKRQRPSKLSFELISLFVILSNFHFFQVID
jgi:hypothetical protein